MLTKDRYSQMCREYERITGVNPLDPSRRHLNVVARQVVSLVFKKKLKYSEYAIGRIVGLDRTNIYHCIDSATEEVKNGTPQYVESVEAWQRVFNVIPLVDKNASFEEALDAFVRNYRTDNPDLSEADILKALRNYAV